MLKINHSYGFFSCCSVRLHRIIQWVNNNKKLPSVVDSSKQYSWYKIKAGDVTFDYFEHYNKVKNSVPLKNIDYKDSYQYIDYRKLDYDSIVPYVTKYFTPSKEIKSIVQFIENKYNLDYDNICVLFYRGNDKNTETQICDYNEYIDKATKIKEENPSIKFLLQSDETEFISTMLDSFSTDSFYFKDEIRTINKQMSTVDKVLKESNNEFSKKYLAITIIMSKCKYVVCGSGNCSIWIMFYRGNANGVYQNLDNVWLE